MTTGGDLPTEFHYTARGQLALRAGQLHAAVDDFNHALAINDEFAPAYYYRGLAYRNGGDLNQAMRITRGR